MNYVTVWETAQQNQLVVLRNLFEKENLHFRILDENTNNNFLTGARVQVEEKDRQKAEDILRENGFAYTRDIAKHQASGKSFWIWFFAALIFLVVVAAVVYELMD